MRTHLANGPVDELFSQTSSLSDPIELLQKVVIEVLALEVEPVTEDSVLGEEIGQLGHAAAQQLLPFLEELNLLSSETTIRLVNLIELLLVKQYL